MKGERNDFMIRERMRVVGPTYLWGEERQRRGQCRGECQA